MRASTPPICVSRSGAPVRRAGSGSARKSTPIHGRLCPVRQRDGRFRRAWRGPPEARPPLPYLRRIVPLASDSNAVPRASRDLPRRALGCDIAGSMLGRLRLRLNAASRLAALFPGRARAPRPPAFGRRPRARLLADEAPCPPHRHCGAAGARHPRAITSLRCAAPARPRSGRWRCAWRARPAPRSTASSRGSKSAPRRRPCAERRRGRGRRLPDLSFDAAAPPAAPRLAVGARHRRTGLLPGAAPAGRRAPQRPRLFPRRARRQALRRRHALDDCRRRQAGVAGRRSRSRHRASSAAPSSPISTSAGCASA